ncbi:MAG: DUF2520 domain-containing protein [Bacteroidia bacterium]|nr:DUF2520 domain-containing protein [Bacteroidia bacterium]NNC85739.1 DUF2520 domain-containing protein [Bacteroidia bacterium]NNM16697.1 DUF2520 domain-containing protein [Bacteroidia bacterium]
MKITLIGSGNVANYLATTLHSHGHSINEVFSRNSKTGRALAKKAKSKFIASSSNLQLNSDAYIIAVNDDEIESVAKTISLKNKLVIHTSGATALNSIKKCSSQYGVVYPLISITKNNKLLPANYTVCIEANNTTALKKCKQLAKCLSNKIIEVNSMKREALHLSAVMVNNFGNHLFAQADKLLTQNKLELDLLYPIINQTADRIQKESPANLQTGPAIRNDKTVMKKHLQIISKNKLLSSLYKSFSKSIFEFNKKK